jgi:DNA ligase-1
MNPFLAEDSVLSGIVFPCGIQPKVDGVRGLTTEGHLTGRSLKKHKNKYTTELYSRPEYINFDGELAAQNWTHPDLCRLTSSVLSTIKGEPFTLWYVFDYLDKYTVSLPYEDRYGYMKDLVEHHQRRGLCTHIRIMPMIICENMEQLLVQEIIWLDQGFEGLIIRNLNALHKQGRSTQSKAELLRVKRFLDGEAIIIAFEEGETNNNEAQKNELGHTFRSSHQDNKVGNGMIGNLTGQVIKDVLDPQSKKLVLNKDQIVTISPGKMDHATRKHLFENPDEILQHISKFKFFAKGIKDKPRFPVHTSLRSPEDM